MEGARTWSARAVHEAAQVCDDELTEVAQDEPSSTHEPLKLSRKAIATAAERIIRMLKRGRSDIIARH
jgi:hypothetical protein